MSIEIESPREEAGFEEFVALYDRVCQDRPVRWRADRELWLPILSGESPFVEDRELRPFVARRDGEVVARVLAVADLRYMRLWKERLGHLVWFEALSNFDAVRALISRGCLLVFAGGRRRGFGFSHRRGGIPLLVPAILGHHPARFRAVLFTAAGLVGATGFLGGALLYGLDHYAW